MKNPSTKDRDMTSEYTDVPEANVLNTNMQEADIMGMKPETYCMLLHLSQLLNFLSACVPLLGTIVPIVLWAIAKDKSPLVDQHGKIILNWQISLFIYVAASGVIAVTCFIFTFLISIAIMLPLFIPFGFIFLGSVTLLVGILMLVFPIIGAVKANEGKVWKYPLSIPFFK